MNIQEVEVSRINPAAYNPRIDLQKDDAEYKKLKRSLSEFGYIDPLIWNEATGNLVGGHQRFKILTEHNNLEKIAVSVVNISETQEKALNLALNKIDGDWDNNKLTILFEELENEEFDTSLTGFDEEEIKSMLSNFDESTIGVLEDYEEPQSGLVCPSCGHTGDKKEFAGSSED